MFVAESIGRGIKENSLNVLLTFLALSVRFVLGMQSIPPPCPMEPTVRKKTVVLTGGGAS